MDKEVLHSERGLKGRVLRACRWVLLEGLGVQGMRLIRQLALTWLLAQEVIGILALVWGVLAVLREWSDTGVRHALIQSSQGGHKDYLDCAWTINLMRNLILAGVLYFGAGFIAEGIYQQPELRGLLRWCCLIVILDGLTSMSLTVMRRELHFRPIAMVQMAANFAGLLAAIGLCKWQPSARSVVIAEILTSGIIFVSSYLVGSYKPKLKFDRSVGLDLLGFGAMAYLVTLVDAVGMRADLLILGKVAPMSDVGIYYLGMVVMVAACGIFSRLTIEVGFPALCLVRHDRAAMRRGVAEIIKGTQLVSLPAFLALGILGPDIVKIMPTKYAEVGEVLRWLSILGLALTFTRQLAPALYALRRVFWCVLRGILALVLVSILVGPMYKYWGLTGACWAANIGGIVTTVMMWVVVLKELGWQWGQWWSSVAVLGKCVMGGAAGMTAAVLIMWGLGIELADVTKVRLILCGGGGVGYAICGWRFYRPGGVCAASKQGTLNKGCV